METSAFAYQRIMILNFFYKFRTIINLERIVLKI